MIVIPCAFRMEPAMALPITSPDDAVRNEAVHFARYLIGSTPSTAEVERYVDAIRTGRFEPDHRDRRTLDFVNRHPRMLGIVDGGLAVRRPQSVVRLRLLVLAAILESTPAHVSAFLPKRRSPSYGLYAGMVAIRAGIRGAIGALVVAWK